MAKEQAHESAELHVTGEARYVDDLVAGTNMLVGRVVYSPHAHARILSVDLSKARQLPGVAAVIFSTDIPGENQLNAMAKDEPCLASGEVVCAGQAVFLIAAETDDQCREAERLIRIKFEPLPAVLALEDAIAQSRLLGPERTMQRGDADAALKTAPHVIRGELRTGAAEHWYLETHASLAIPGEGPEMTVFSSSQNPTETQAVVAEVLGLRKKDVVVEVRRMGGAFGGKETQANHIAAWAALLANATKRPVKLRLARDDDMIMTGKRHRFLTRYEAGFDNEGKLLAVKIELNSDAGMATDLSFAIMERAMLHSDNAYFIPNMLVSGRVWKTNLPSNTAFRGFGGPQAMAAIETIVDRIARVLGRDSAEIRRTNFYGVKSNNVTHYGQTVERNRLHTLYDQLHASSDYASRRARLQEFNAAHEFEKRGLALTPVKFGIAFTTTFMNQAGALVNIYSDGTVLVNHGGTEMGQGLHTKIQRIAATELGVSLDRIRVSATNTSKVPNTPPTAASSGSDLNGMAVKNAIDTLKSRISEAVAAMFTESSPPSPSQPSDIVFQDDVIFDRAHADRKMPFAEVMGQLVKRQVSLSATGYFRMPDIGWDKIKGVGTPFRYYAFGMAVSEVEVDVLTGAVTMLRTDILHDVGSSISPAIDRGQIEGGFIQGVGWCTTEEIKWDAEGRLLTHSPDTYKIPSARDLPLDFRVETLQNADNPNAIFGSKAVGEPPLMLCFSVWLAIKDAVSAVADHRSEPEFSLPATTEVILLSIEKLKASVRESPKAVPA